MTSLRISNYKFLSRINLWRRRRVWITDLNVMFVYVILVATITSISGKCITKKPHIVFVLADDLGWNDVSFHGSLQIPTPNIDVLASSGVVLNNYYVQHLCSPSRAALLTGRHPIHLGMQHYVLLALQSAGLPLHVKLLPEYLRNLGYATHAIGKWHLGFHKKEYTPTYRGFDSFLGTWQAFMDYYDHTYLAGFRDVTTKEQLLWGRALRDGMEPADKYLGKYATDIFTDRTVDIINNHNVSQPLFLYVSHLAVHSGNSYRLYQSPMKELLEMNHIKDKERQVFAGVVGRLDKSVGKIFKALHKKGMMEDVIFIFSTDNGGESFSFRNGQGSNWPLRGNKGTFWEGGIRGTAFIWSRLLRKKKRISNQLMHISDWLPTLYSAAGGNVNDLEDVYGLDLWDSLSYDLPSQREEILHNIDPVDKASALRMEKYKLIIGSNLGGKSNDWFGPVARDNEIDFSSYQRKLRKSDAWKILKKHGWLELMTDEWRSQLDIRCKLRATNRHESTICDPNLTPCLFDIEKDPCEERNLADDLPEVLRAMMDRLEEYSATATPVQKPTSDPRANPFLHSFLWTNWAQDL